MNHDQHNGHRINEVLRGKLAAHNVDAGRDQKSAEKDASTDKHGPRRNEKQCANRLHGSERDQMRIVMHSERVNQSPSTFDSEDNAKGDMQDCEGSTSGRVQDRATLTTIVGARTSVWYTTQYRSVRRMSFDTSSSDASVSTKILRRMS